MMYEIPLSHTSYIPDVFPAHGDGEAYQVHSQCQLMMFQK
jgi:hypothetical protein